MVTLTIRDVESLLSRIETLTDEVRKLSANNRIVVSTVHAHGAVIERMETSLRTLQFHCPMFEMVESKQTNAGNGDTDVRESSPRICAELEDTNKD